MTNHPTSLSLQNPDPSPGALTPGEPMSVEALQDWLIAQIAEQTGLDADEVDVHTPFHQFGLDSVQAMGIATLGQQRFGLEISPLVMWNCPNIEALSRHLAEELLGFDHELFSI